MRYSQAGGAAAAGLHEGMWGSPGLGGGLEGPGFQRGTVGTGK